MDALQMQEILSLPAHLRGIAAEAVLAGMEVSNLRAWAAAVHARENASCGSVRLDAEEVVSQVATSTPRKVERWRVAVLGEEIEMLLDVLREQGTAGLAARLGVSQRRAQQNIRELVAEVGQQRDMFWGEAK